MSDQIVEQILPVIQDVVDGLGEDVVDIDPEIAQVAADLAWADGVEEDIARRRAESARNELTRRQNEDEAATFEAALLRAENDEAASAEPLEDEAIWLLKYNRIRQEFHQALEGPEFEPCREALGAIGKSCKAPWGGYILVHANQYPHVMDKLNGWTR